MTGRRGRGAGSLAPMAVDLLLREAWARSEAQCECATDSHGHVGRCRQFLVWEDRGGTQKGGWEIRQLNDPRLHPLQVLCVECYAKLTGHVPQGF